jgi:Reverse transcriptase (RNA-dependent DNA polymerase)
MCLDYRALNKLAVMYRCPIPRVDELLDRFGGATHFSSIDLRSGYYQIQVREKDVPKTCIHTRYGSYEFMVMPFGVTNAPSTCQALMNDEFRDDVDKFMLVYLDDVLIVCRSAEVHKEHVELVLKRLRDEKLFAKLSKCEFNVPSVTFLGHNVGQEGLSMERKKVECVLRGRVRQQSSSSSRFCDLPTIIIVLSKASLISRRQSPLSLVRRMRFCGARNTTRPLQLEARLHYRPCVEDT